MKCIHTGFLAGLLAALLLLNGCGVFAPKEDPPVPEEYQQTATVVFDE